MFLVKFKIKILIPGKSSAFQLRLTGAESVVGLAFEKILRTQT
jgi:hypothetical protein